MGFPGAHNVRRRPQGLGVARDVSAPRIGVRILGQSPITMPAECGRVARISAVGSHSRIDVRTTSKPSAVDQWTVPTCGPPEAH
jgi:hypothetical protein